MDEPSVGDVGVAGSSHPVTVVSDKTKFSLVLEALNSFAPLPHGVFPLGTTLSLGHHQGKTLRAKVLDGSNNGALLLRKVGFYCIVILLLLWIS